MKALLSGALAIISLNTVGANTASAQEERPTPLHTKNKEKPKRNTTPCLISDLAPTQFALTGSRINGSKITLTFAGTIRNRSNCDAKASRTKGVLTLKGGKWIGQAKFDHPIIPKRGSSTYEMAITFPFKDFLVDGALNRSDWILTVTADWLKKVPESDEGNNEQQFPFSTSSLSLAS